MFLNSTCYILLLIYVKHMSTFVIVSQLSNNDVKYVGVSAYKECYF